MGCMLILVSCRENGALRTGSRQLPPSPELSPDDWRIAGQVSIEGWELYVGVGLR